MAPPDFQEIMLPMLQLADDGRERRLSDAIEQLAQRLNLSDADRNELLPSGQQSRFDNRVGWARTHLGKRYLSRARAVVVSASLIVAALHCVRTHHASI
jgi:restriction system protein